MESVALISDAHADLKALQATLDAIESKGITRIWCLGDFCVGGYEPLQCYDIIMEKCEIVLLGNHEMFLLFKLWNKQKSRWADGAKLAYDALGEERFDELFTHRSSVQLPYATLVHGALTHPADDFLVGGPTAKRNMDMLGPPLLLFGHTHIQTMWEPHKRGRWVKETPITLGKPIALPSSDDILPKRLINPGAVCDSGGARWAHLVLDKDNRSITFYQEKVGGHGGEFSATP